MSADEECECIQQECEAGAPAWVMTFADLMSLLMCFFVLLLSFSEMDVQKFKQVAGSMERAFGVQRQVKAPDIPMGTSVIAQEFSPGKVEPSLVDEVRQSTTTEDINLDTAKDVMEAEAQAQAEQLRQKLQQEIDEGLIEVDSQEDKVIIRIKEKGSFPSGTAELHAEFLPTLERIRAQIASTPGTISIAGHTDNVPIKTFRFRSNWELSSSRAVSVLEQLLKDGTIKPEDTEVKGLADTQPLVPNDSRENRAINRRVEIMISPSSHTLVSGGAEGAAAVETETPPEADTGASIIPPLPESLFPDDGAVPEGGIENSIIPPLPESLIPDDGEVPEGGTGDSIIPPLPESLFPDDGAVPEGGAGDSIIPPLPESLIPDFGAVPEGGAETSITPPLPVSIVIQDDGEVPALQPELSREIEDLFGNMKNQ
jgi:chemotaxis protein MotB